MCLVVLFPDGDSRGWVSAFVGDSVRDLQQAQDAANTRMPTGPPTSGTSRTGPNATGTSWTISPSMTCTSTPARSTGTDARSWSGTTNTGPGPCATPSTRSSTAAVGLARLGGNFGWQVRLSDDGTQQFCYRLPSADPVTASAPHLATTFWEAKSLGRPGAASVGLNALGGVYNRFGVASPRSSGGFTVYRPEHWAFEGTDLYYGDVVGGVPVCLAAFELDAVEYTFRRGLPFPTFEDGAPESLEILGLACAQRGEEDRWGGHVPLGGPVKEMQATLDALGDDLPSYVREGENRGAGMIAAFRRGRGEVFNGGSTEWPYALSAGDPYVGADRPQRPSPRRFTSSG